MRILLTLIIGWFTCALVAQDSLQTLWLRGQEAYAKQDYPSCISSFMRLQQVSKPSASAMYNLANCYMHNGDLDHAILWYERALRLDPLDSDILHNHSIANSQRINPIIEIDQFFIVHWIGTMASALSVLQWTILHLFFVWMLIGVCIWALRKGEWKQLRWIAIVAGLCALITGGLAMQRNAKMTSRNAAVVMGDPISLLLGADSLSTEISRISPGEKVIILDSLDNFYKVRLPNLEQGWIPLKSVERI